MLVPAMAVAMLAGATTAPAAEVEMTRGEYVKRVEPVCAANTKANSRILKGIKGQVKKGKLFPAGKRFIRAAGALNRAVRQINRVPRPPADEARLRKWIRYLHRERSFLQRIGKSLKGGNKFKAQKLAVKLNRNNNQANNLVISFGFKECRIDSSKFL